MSASDGVSKPCRNCGVWPDEYAYGGRHGYICDECHRQYMRDYSKRIYERGKVPCPSCGERLYHPRHGKTCAECAPLGGMRATRRGQPIRTSNGYLQVKLPPGDPMISMGNSQNHVLQHRLVMADYIGRPLARDEVVHHRNHDKQDNRLENLALMSHVDHSRMHATEQARSNASHRERM